MIKKTNRKKVIHCNLNDIYMSVAFNKGIVVVLHAPKSCSHIVYNALLDSWRRIALRYHKKLPALNDNLFVTGISDKETIFGTEKYTGRDNKRKKSRVYYSYFWLCSWSYR